MTWLGKTLALAAVVLALVWMWLTASVYVARTNWKNQADTYKEAFEKARTARTAEYQLLTSKADAVARQKDSAFKQVEGLAAQVAALRTESGRYTDELAKLNSTYRNSDAKATELQASLLTLEDELKRTRERANLLEEERVRLIAAREKAENERQGAQIAARVAEAERDVARNQYDEVRAEYVALRDRVAGGGGGGGAPIPGVKPPPAVPEGLRGTVDAYAGGYAAISVGLEAGVAPGQTLDVYRGPTYLGTLTVTASVRPKDAVAKFNPADRTRKVEQLRADQLPQKGDTVGRVGAGR